SSTGGRFFFASLPILPKRNNRQGFLKPQALFSELDVSVFGTVQDPRSARSVLPASGPVLPIFRLGIEP
ncbi:MAG: hypothetical protein PHO07_10905, partial [Pirellulales bacterium]|nr:hypothetical protein [Pirellulales bacterium]